MQIQISCVYFLVLYVAVCSKSNSPYPQSPQSSP